MTSLHYRRLNLWNKGIELAQEVYRLAVLLPREERYGMRAQITRAAASVPANVAEGWTRESPREKAKFLAIAHGSLAETETFLTLCERMGWFQLSETDKLRALIGEVGRMLTKMRQGFRSRDNTYQRNMK